MAYQQVKQPNLQVWQPSAGTYAGYCEEYVSDALDTPSQNRLPSATASFQNEKKWGNIRVSQNFPVGVTVVGYLSLAKEPAGHVFFVQKQTDGSLLIHDSDWRSGVRKNPYRSIAELLAWFGNFGPSFIGWSIYHNGIQLAREVADPVVVPTPKPTPPVTASDPQIGDRVETTATVDAGSGVKLNLGIINDGQSVWTETNSRGNAVLRKDGIVRTQVPINSLRRI